MHCTTNCVVCESQRCLAKSFSRPLDLHKPSNNTHTSQHSTGPIDADREGRVKVRGVTGRVKERKKHGDKGRESEKGIKHAVD